jgi:dTDP-D-glucose 4,6-dehydratase
VTLLELIAALNRILKTDLDPVFVARVGDVKFSKADIRTRADLGYQPRVSFEEGLQDTVEWYLDACEGLSCPDELHQRQITSSPAREPRWPNRWPQSR